MSRQEIGKTETALSHLAIESVLTRANLAASDSDFTYFFDLLLVAEAITKITTLAVIAAIADDKDRTRYRLEHAIVRADGLGDWCRALEDALTGSAAQYLVADAYPAQAELTRSSSSGSWQYSSLEELKSVLRHLKIEAEDLPVKSDMKRWFRLFSTLRNKTRGHGATKSGDVGIAAQHLKNSIDLLYTNCSFFSRPWVYLHRNLSGKYRVSQIAGNGDSVEYLKKETSHVFENGVYIIWDAPRRVSLLRTNAELDDFYFANGNFSAKRFEFISYRTDDKIEGNSQEFSAPPGTLPKSETHGSGELLVRNKCLSNAPDLISDYISRPKLEDELKGLLLDDKRPIVTLRGKGGIGKTSLALRVLESIYDTDRYMTVVWLSARDVDLDLTGPKPVRPNVVSPDEISKLYAGLVLAKEVTADKNFHARSFFEGQLSECECEPTLFVFDNFETTQNPAEMFAWIDTYIRLPNKILITTRLRDFKGDYPVDVSGMTEPEAKMLIRQTSVSLGVSDKVSAPYADALFHESEGHPYVIKILLGEVARTGGAKNIPKILAGSDEILAALFERTYSALSPCAQRAFLTLSAWNSSVPRLALEAVLLRSTGERHEVEEGIETLLQYSLAEAHAAPKDRQEFLALPLVASTFGKKKLNISPYKAAIHRDAEILQMLGPSRRDDIHLGMASRLDKFVSGVAKRIDSGESYLDYEPLLDMICRNYPLGWLSVARWQIETGSEQNLERARHALTRFLECEAGGQYAAEAWRLLAFVCYRTNDGLGEIHAFIERAQLADVPFYDVSNSANRLNQLLRTHGLDVDKDEKQALASRLLAVMENRKSEADADDFSRMAWLAIHLGREADARIYTRAGLALDADSFHCGKLAARLSIPEYI